MNELRFTETNAADDSAGRAFGLEGNLYVPVVIAVVGAVALFALLTLLLRINFVPAGLAAGLPVIIVVGWVMLLRNGRPAGYDRDFLENAVGGGDFTRGVADESYAKSHSGAPDGRFVDDMILFGSPERGGLVSKGFLLEPPDLRGASVERLNAFHECERRLLGLIGPGRRLQVGLTCDPNYRPELERFHQDTQPIDDPAIREARNERVARYSPRLHDGTLRRERCVLFYSIELNAYSGNVRTRGGVLSQYDTLLRELAAQFEEFAATLGSVFGPETAIRPMGDLEHFECISRFLNPSIDRRGAFDAGGLFDPGLTVQENCWHGEAVGQREGGFFLDGHYHAVLTLARWPQRTRPGIVTHLTGLPFLDYAITVNVTPIASRQEIQREENVAERLRGEYAEKPRPSLLVALRKKERKVEALSGGFARPFHATYVIRVWAATRDALREKIAAVQAAIQGMDGAQYFECALPATAKKLFFATWPGWTHSSYRHRGLYAEDNYLADMLPFSATFTGNLAQAEALYDGGHLNLVGVSAQTGGSPQHALVCGMTGSGKSEFIDNLFLQTAGFFQHTLIIDIGFSHQKFTEALGEKVIVLHPDSDLTINYLDTQGLPLTQLHLATAVTLIARMVGTPDIAEQLALRQAQLSAYVHQLYADTFVDWSRRRPTEAEEVRRLACAVHRWRVEKMPEGSTPLDAFVELRDRRAANDEQALSFVAALSEANVTRFAQDPATARFIAQTACAFYSPEEFPTHGALVELLAYARLPEHNKDEIDRLATLLRAWTVSGEYGKLFDGATNVSLRRKHAHIEMGLMPDGAIGLKAVAGLLISGISRQHILSLPRAYRKRILFEEVSRFLDIPGGEQIVAESYEQLRKYNCWAVSVVQQYCRFRASRVRSAVIGNAKQFFLLRQSDRNDMADLAGDVGLPETAVDAIQHYPLPEQQPAGERYSSICYFSPTAQPPQCGTIRHIQSHAHASAA